MNGENSNAPKEKMSFLKWIDNFWYHHKAAVIIGFVALLIAVVCTVQMLSKKKPDVFIYFVGYGDLSAQKIDEFTDDMEARFASDYNGDGKVFVDYKADVFIEKQVNGVSYVDNNLNNNVTFNDTQRFTLELGVMTGDCVIYIMEEGFFYPNTSYFADLEEVLGYVPENAIYEVDANGRQGKAKGIRLGDLRAYKSSDLFQFPEDCIICMARKKQIFSEEYYNGHKQFFSNLVGNKVNKNLVKE